MEPNTHRFDAQRNQNLRFRHMRSRHPGADTLRDLTLKLNPSKIEDSAPRPKHSGFSLWLWGWIPLRFGLEVESLKFWSWSWTPLAKSHNSFRPNAQGQNLNHKQWSWLIVIRTTKLYTKGESTIRCQNGL